MRIIAGEARGLTLSPPPRDIRPTMDRVRAAIFSSLGDAVPGAKVLDLFAGSGAMGIEALSRGAESAVLVEANPECVRCIRGNLQRAGLNASVQAMDAMKFLDLYVAPASYDLIFADPPYAKAAGSRDFSAELVQHAGLAASLRPGGIFVLERFFSKNPAAPLLHCHRVRRYGETEVAYFSRSE